MQVYDKNWDYHFSYKTNRRNKDELNDFILMKREKDREKKIALENKQREEQMKNFLEIVSVE